MRPIYVCAFILFSIVLFALGFFITRRLGPPPRVPEPIVRADASSAKDATYEIEGERITLQGGVFEAAAPDSAAVISTRYFGNESYGDLNGDGTEDVAFILTRQTGASGTFYYLTAALKTPSGYQGLSAILLGDRIAPQQTEIRGGMAVANFAVRAEGEPMTTPPSVGVSTYAKVAEGKLVVVPAPR